MLNIISMLSGVSLVLILFVVILMFSKIKQIFSKSYTLLTLSIVIVYLIHSLTNFLQWTGIENSFDVYEDYFLLILPILWIFLLYAYMKNISQKEVKASEEKYRILAENASDVIWVYDLKDEKYNYVSPSIKQIFGYSVEEALKQKLEDHIPSSEIKKLHDEFQKEKQNRNEVQNRRMEFKQKKKDGSVFWTEISYSFLKNEVNNPIGILGITRDISKRKKVELEREKATKKLKKVLKELANSQKDMEEFLYATSHDLRTPVINIMGFNKELEGDLKELKSILGNAELPQNVSNTINKMIEQDIDESLNYIISSTKKIDTLLTGLLQISRLGREPLRLQELDVNLAVERALDDFRFHIKENNIEVDVAQLPKCKCDKSQITQLFSNLISNSLKNLDPDRKGCLKIYGEKKGYKCVYHFEDNGVGIAKNDIDKVLKPFYKINPKKQGEGLGLTIAQRIVKNHNGEIKLESTLNEGTKFLIILPAD